MFERLQDTILRSDYIRYLEYLDIDTNEIINNIKKRVDIKDLFSVFENQSYSMLSPNIILENIIFEEVNKYLYKNKYDLNLFKRDIEIDIKSLIATQNSLIERPAILKPSELKKGYKENLYSEDEFIQIARFENKMIKDNNGWGREGQTLVFEGISIFEKNNPFLKGLPSSLIWNNAFYYQEKFIIGWVENFNSIEATNILWIDSLLQYDLGLRLDNFNNGLQAVNEKDEVVLKFRQWRCKLIDSEKNSNIAQLEGCDLMIREDYYEKLKMIIPYAKFYSDKLELKL